MKDSDRQTGNHPFVLSWHVSRLQIRASPSQCDMRRSTAASSVVDVLMRAPAPAMSRMLHPVPSPYARLHACPAL